jgi:hypothetical protein
MTKKLIVEATKTLRRLRQERQRRQEAETALDEERRHRWRAEAWQCYAEQKHREALAQMEAVEAERDEERWLRRKAERERDQAEHKGDELRSQAEDLERRLLDTQRELELWKDGWRPQSA